MQHTLSKYMSILIFSINFFICITNANNLLTGLPHFGFETPIAPYVAGEIKPALYDYYVNHPLSPKTKIYKETIEAALKDIPSTYKPKTKMRTFDQNTPFEITCPHDFTLQENRCLKVVMKEATTVCPYGTIQTMNFQCKKSEALNPEYLCPHTFKPFLKGCIRRVKLTPQYVCPEDFHHFNETLCVKVTQLTPNIICPETYKLSDINGVSTCVETLNEKIIQKCSNAEHIEMTNENLEVLTKNLLKMVSLTAPQLLIELNALKLEKKFTCLYENKLKPNYECPYGFKLQYRVQENVFSNETEQPVGQRLLFDESQNSTVIGIIKNSINNTSLEIKESTLEKPNFDTQSTVPKCIKYWKPFPLLDSELETCDETTCKSTQVDSIPKCPLGYDYTCAEISWLNSTNLGKPCEYFECRKISHYSGIHVCPENYTANSDNCVLQNAIPPTLECPLKTQTPDEKGFCNALEIKEAKKSCPSGYHVGPQIPDKSPKLGKIQRGSLVEDAPLPTICELVEYAEVQAICPKGYKLTGSIKQHSKVCVAERIVPSVKICDAGYFLKDGSDTKASECEMIFEAPPTLIQKKNSINATNPLPPNVSVCNFASENSLSCNQQRHFYGSITQAGESIGAQYLKKLNTK